MKESAWVKGVFQRYSFYFNKTTIKKQTSFDVPLPQIIVFRRCLNLYFKISTYLCYYLLFTAEYINSEFGVNKMAN